MSFVLRSSHPKARKPHTCEWCYTIIAPGVTYSRQTCIYDDRLYDWVACLDCMALANRVSDYWGHPDEGLSEDSFRDWAEEHPDDAGASAYLTRRSPSTGAQPDEPVIQAGRPASGGA